METQSLMNATSPQRRGCEFTFVTKDTVSADFTYNVRYGCLRDTIDYFGRWP